MIPMLSNQTHPLMDILPTEFPRAHEAERKLAHLLRLFIAVAAAALVLLAAAAASVVAVVPKFDKVFSDLLGDKPLPAMTELGIALSRFGDGWGFLLFTAVLPLATVVLLVTHPDKRSAWWMTTGVLMFLLLLIVGVSLSLALPLIAITTELGAP